MAEAQRMTVADVVAQVRGGRLDNFVGRRSRLVRGADGGGDLGRTRRGGRCPNAYAALACGRAPAGALARPPGSVELAGIRSANARTFSCQPSSSGPLSPVT